MAPSKKNRRTRRYKKSNLFKNVKNTTARALPIVESGLKNVGSSVKNVAVKSAPYVEKGISGVYDTLATGFDMGIKGVKKIAKSSKKHRKHGKSKKH